MSLPPGLNSLPDGCCEYWRSYCFIYGIHQSGFKNKALNILDAIPVPAPRGRG